MCICMGCVLANRLTHITQKNGLDLLMLTFPAARSGHSPKTTTRMNLGICPLCALCLAILRTCLAYNKPLLCFSRHCLCLAISRTCCTYRMKVVPFATLSRGGIPGPGQCAPQRAQRSPLLARRARSSDQGPCPGPPWGGSPTWNTRLLQSTMRRNYFCNGLIAYSCVF